MRAVLVFVIVVMGLALLRGTSAEEDLSSSGETGQHWRDLAEDIARQLRSHKSGSALAHVQAWLVACAELDPESALILVGAQYSPPFSLAVVLCRTLGGCQGAWPASHRRDGVLLSRGGDGGEQLLGGQSHDR